MPLLRQYLSYPLIIKPSLLGSSIGVHKVENEKELLEKLVDAFKYDEVVIIEEAVTNLKEINIALLRKNNEIICFFCAYHTFFYIFSICQSIGVKLCFSK